MRSTEATLVLPAPQGQILFARMFAPVRVNTAQNSNQKVPTSIGPVFVFYAIMYQIDLGKVDQYNQACNSVRALKLRIAATHFYPHSTMRCILSLLLCVLLAAEPSVAAFYYPTVQVSLLDHILVDNWGAYASNFSSAITPCTNYVTEVGEPALISGRTTAAQWIRVAFHDFVTANVTAGTGGLDASIGFETLRSENSGSAMNDSFTFWRPFMNDAVSSEFSLVPQYWKRDRLPSSQIGFHGSAMS